MLYELIDRPELETPVLVVAMEGWIDAGLAAAGASTVLLDTLDTVTVARFDTDALLDYRARRPTVHMIDGVQKGLTWPSLELRAATDLDGKELLLLVGSEPDRIWHRFVDEVVDLALDFDVRLCVGLGAYPAPAPHTRPSRMACTASTAQLAEAGLFLRASLDFPGGAQAAVEQACDARGIASLGIWAQVPHYASGMNYPAASVGLIECLARMADLSLPLGDLPERAAATRSRLDELIGQNPDHEAMLHQLEAAYERLDEGIASLDGAPLPTGDELAAELERFLRDQNE
ncbi:MAG: proteasome assembly chaperone family protein [Acidimicrobiales bacterium]